MNMGGGTDRKAEVAEMSDLQRDDTRKKFLRVLERV